MAIVSYLLLLSLFVRPQPVEPLFETVVDHEGDTNVQDHSGHSRNCALVKSLRTFIDHDLFCTIESIWKNRRQYRENFLNEKKNRFYFCIC